MNAFLVAGFTAERDRSSFLVLQTTKSWN